MRKQTQKERSSGISGRRFSQIREKCRWLFVLALLGPLLGLPPLAYPENSTVVSSSEVPPGTLSVDEAVHFGLTHHPKLFWFTHAVKRQGAKVKVSKSHFFPHVGAGAIYGESNPGLTDRPYNNNNFIDPLFPMTYAAPGALASANLPTAEATIGVNQMLFDFGKFEHRVKQRLAGKRASEFWLYSQEAWVILQVKEAYYHVLLDRKLIEVYQKNLEQRKLVKNLTKALYQSDYRSQLDYDLAQVDYEKARALLESEKDDLVAQIAHLNDAMGLGQAGRPDYTLTGRLGHVSELLTGSAEAITRGLTYRPEINAFRNLFTQDKEQMRYERAQHYPLISAFGSYGWFGNMATGQSYAPGGGWWAGGGSITIPLYTGGQIRGLTERDLEKSRERQYGISDWSHNIRYQVVRARARTQSDLADIRAYTEAVKEAKLALVLANKRYSANLISIVALTLAEVYLLNTEASLATYQYRYQVDRATLRFAEGVDYLNYLPDVRKKVAGLGPVRP
ncbi:MAG: TolC family protein [Nitrospiraceae bacterium]|nr:TolC family protein [Nitrospiraceae bacterium]